MKENGEEGKSVTFSFTGIETEQEMKGKGSWHYLTAGLCYAI